MRKDTDNKLKMKVNKKLNKSNKNTLIALGALAGATVTLAIAAKKIKSNRDNKNLLSVDEKNRQVYFIGGGLASLAGAAYLIRDCDFEGENIHILEEENELANDKKNGFVCSRNSILNEETYENLWQLFSSILSLDKPNMSVTEEILNFDHLHPTHAQARLVDKYGVILDAHSMGFNHTDRLALEKLFVASEEELGDMTILEWFTPHFFETNFWYMWQTTFAFKKYSSLVEFRRYINRMILEFPRIDTLEGITQAPYNNKESLILPLKTYLHAFGVNFHKNSVVTDLDFKDTDELTVKAIHIKDGEEDRVIELNEGDVCIMINGCITENLSLGDLNSAPTLNKEYPNSVKLWKNVSDKRPGLGNPEVFFNSPEKTNWESFTVTCKGNKILKIIEEITGNIPGSLGLMTFKDSNWMMSINVFAQPHFKDQPLDVTTFFGYGLYTDRVGNYVKKQMHECTGKEILEELLYHLHLEDEIDELMDTVIDVVPCMMPYANSGSQPRKIGDRPNVIPDKSTNFAMVGQFVEMEEDIVATEEYEVRSARTAIYSLFNVRNRKVCPVTEYRKKVKVIKNALKALYR